VGLDDVHKECCAIDYPLLRAINDGLLGLTYDSSLYGCP
jgi:hypothetical protein